MKTKIYFIESSTDFNNSDLNSSLISGSEKTLINISISYFKHFRYLYLAINITFIIKKYK